MKRVAAILIISLVTAVAATAMEPQRVLSARDEQGRPEPRPEPPPPEDPIGRFLFPPELIMNHSAQLGLQESQKTTIKSEVRKAQGFFFDLQWDLRDANDRMEALLQQRPLDEVKVLEQADRMMAIEREIKRAHLAMLIRIRNALIPDQLARLDAIRRVPR